MPVSLPMPHGGGDASTYTYSLRKESIEYEKILMFIVLIIPVQQHDVLRIYYKMLIINTTTSFMVTFGLSKMVLHQIFTHVINLHNTTQT